jgi:hypothetical protein
MSYAQLMVHAEDIRRRAVEAALTTVEDHPEYRPSVERAFADVPDAFRPFARLPDPAMFDAMLADLVSVLNGLGGPDPVSGVSIPANVELERMGGAAVALARWTGPAASRFRAGFLEPFPALVRNQFIVAAVLRAALAAQREIWVRARDDIDQIAEKTLDALDATADCTRNEWTITFTVVASVAALAVVPLSGGAALAVSAVGAAAQVAAAGGPEEPVRTAFSGDDPVDVVDRMRDAITLLHGHIRDQRAKVDAALRATHDLVIGHRRLFAGDGSFSGTLGYAH